MRVRLQNVQTNSRVSVEVNRLLIAGFTGRSTVDVQEHIAELQQSGIAAPERVPEIYQISPDLLTTESQIRVEGSNTSGEIEPVVVKVKDEWVLGVGSDHTDRDIETVSIERSKGACPKVIGSECISVSDIPAWDSIAIRSWIEEDAYLYQDGKLSNLLPLTDILSVATQRVGSLADGDVIFLGTIPIRGGNVSASRLFRGELHITGTPHVLSLSYSTHRVSRQEEKLDEA